MRKMVLQVSRLDIVWEGWKLLPNPLGVADSVNL